MSASSPDFQERYRALLIRSRQDARDALEQVSAWWRSEWRQLTVEDRARLRRLRAHCLHTLARMEPARREYEAAFAVFEKKGLPEEMVPTAIGWIDCLAHLGRLKEARSLARRVESLLPGREVAGRARLRANLANALYLSGQVEEAQRLLRRALRSLDRVGHERDAALCRFNLGQMLLAQGKARRARHIFSEAREVFEDSGFTQSALQAAYGEATARLLQGEWVEGFEQLEEVRRRLDELGDERAVAAVQWELSRFMGALGAYEAAEAAAAEALQVHRRLGLVRETALLSSLRARWLNEMGRTLDARVLLERALEFWKRTRRRLPAARVQVELAAVLLERGDAETAQRRLAPLQALLDAHDRWGTAVVCRQLRSRAHRRLGRPGLALRLAAEAFASAHHPLLLALRPSLALDAALAAADAGDGRSARRWLRRFAAELEAIQARLGSRVLQALRASAHEGLVREAVELALRTDRSSRLAYELVTRLSSAGFLQELARGAFAVDPRLRTSLALLRDRLLEGDTEEDDSRVRGLQLRLQSLQEELASPAGQRMAAAVSSPSPRMRPPHPRVLYYREIGGWVAYVHGPSSRVRRVRLPGVDEALARQWLPLRLLLESSASRPRDRRRLFLQRTVGEARQALLALRKVLVEPLRLDASRIELIPHGVLHELPLEAVVNAEAGDDAHEWVMVSRRPHPRWNPRFKRRPHRALLLDDGRRASRRESDELGVILRERGWSVEHGRRRALLQTGPRRGLIHLAAHGVHHPLVWFLNGIRLQDGWLGFEQIPEDVAGGGMVYLDSCESGLGLQGDGVETMGWMAAGLGAGAREMVLTLWKIDDASARIFASAFHRVFAADGDAPAALRAAQVEVRSLLSHPFHWAAFSLIAS